MKLTTKLIGAGVLGAAVAGAGIVRRRAKRAQSPAMRPEDLPVAGQMTDTDLRDIAMHSGISDVDPQNLSHVAGEGIDLDLDTAAHDTLVEVRERMP